MERAETLERTDAAALQRDVFGDHLVDPRVLADVLDVLTADPHGPDLLITWPEVYGAPPTPGSPGDAEAADTAEAREAPKCPRRPKAREAHEAREAREAPQAPQAVHLPVP